MASDLATAANCSNRPRFFRVDELGVDNIALVNYERDLPISSLQVFVKRRGTARIMWFQGRGAECEGEQQSTATGAIDLDSIGPRDYVSLHLRVGDIL